MNVCVRAMSCVALLGTTVLGLSQLRPAWAERCGLDWWNVPEWQEEIRRGEQQLAQTQARCEATQARLDARQEVVADLRAGRLTLVQAAARFRRINASGGGSLVDTRFYYPEATEEECLCRQVIAFAEGNARCESSESAEGLRDRLETELRGLLAQDGGVIRLPE